MNVTSREVDSDFFDDQGPKAHVIGVRRAGEMSTSKKHFKSKEKIRRLHPGKYA